MFFSVSGLRGVVGKDLTDEVVKRYLSGFYHLVGGGRICVGRDSRRDSGDLAELVKETLSSYGGEVIDIGVAPTPTVLYTVRKLGLDGGIVVTASHNPYPYNGLKFVTRGGRFLFYHEIRELNKTFKINYGPGRIISAKGVELHLEAILDHPLVEKDCGFRIGVDPVNGAACQMIKSLLLKMGCEVYAINDQPSGYFNRPPEPTKDALNQLSELVRSKQLNLGLALDPDGDRLSIVAEDGIPLGEEYTLPIIAQDYLRYKKGPIVVNRSTSRMIDTVADDFCVPLYRTRVGEANVVEKIVGVSAAIGGEGNGGIIIPELNMTRDGILAAALVVSILKREDSRPSELVARFPRLVMRKERLTVNLKKWKRLKQMIAAEFVGEHDATDGIWIGKGDFWLHLRPSRTEPVIRLIIEAKDEGVVEDAIQRISKIIRNLG
ncbi:hypothetical protein DRP53_05195 [candidate division WOR-3 bacterium]|uniref:Phosphoglucosamine mutase n=1 Tax=candidate division WOR-3 bacterium TaxID=2052148 RepID=A0A660SHT5_UNCW3|nr:MAG: hypothetical protein DRP53_05195 [candidate division WOR-3 bacterium]